MEIDPNSFEVPEDFSKKTNLKTRAFEVEGRLLWVCPEQLACHSPVFEKLFFGQFAEKEKEVIPLEGKTIADFVIFLTCLTSIGQEKLIQEHYQVIFRLADEYMVEILAQLALEELRKSKLHSFDPNNIDHASELLDILVLAHKYKNRDLFVESFKLVVKAPYQTCEAGSDFELKIDGIPSDIKALCLKAFARKRVAIRLSCKSCGFVLWSSSSLETLIPNCRSLRKIIAYIDSSGPCPMCYKCILQSVWRCLYCDEDIGGKVAGHFCDAMIPPDLIEKAKNFPF